MKRYMHFEGGLTAVRGLHMKDVCRCVALYYGLAVEDLTLPGPSGSRILDHHRQLAAALSYWLTYSSTSVIARYHGYRDHTAVCRASQRVLRRAAQDPMLAAEVTKLRNVLTALRRPPANAPASQSQTAASKAA